jgi:signal transduction histidine kinase
MEVKPATVLLQVVDTGIGIAPLDLPRLFEKFYRSGRREAYQQRGTGLGLAIVKSITERHNGRVWVDSQLGKGSVFSLELPIRQSQPEMVAVSKNSP